MFFSLEDFPGDVLVPTGMSTYTRSININNPATNKLNSNFKTSWAIKLFDQRWNIDLPNTVLDLMASFEGNLSKHISHKKFIKLCMQMHGDSGLMSHATLYD